MNTDLEVEAAPDLDAAPVEMSAPEPAKAELAPDPIVSDVAEPEALDAEPERETVDELDALMAKIEKDMETPAAERGEDGKFKGKTETPEPAKTEDGVAWDSEHKKVFDAAPEPVKAMVKAREAAIDAATTEAANKHYDGIVQYAKAAEPIMQVVQDPEVSSYLQRVSHETQQPVEAVIGNVLKFEKALRYGTLAQKQAAFSHMAKSYGLQMDPLAGDDPAEGLDSVEQRAHDAEQKLREREFQDQQRRRSEERAAEHHVTTELAAFASAKDANGNPKYPFLEQVKVPMGRLIGQGKASTLQEAYDQAAAPLTAALKAERARETERLTKRNADAVARARRTQPVRASMGQRSVNGVPSLDDLISANMGA